MKRYLKVHHCGTWKVLTWWMSHSVSSSGTWTWWVFLSTVRLRRVLSSSSVTVCQWKSSNRLPNETRSCPPENELIPENKEGKKNIKLFEIIFTIYCYFAASSTRHTSPYTCSILDESALGMARLLKLKHTKEKSLNYHIIQQLVCCSLKSILAEFQITRKTQGQSRPSIPGSLWNCTFWIIDIYIFFMEINIMMDHPITNSLSIFSCTKNTLF